MKLIWRDCNLKIDKVNFRAVQFFFIKMKNFFGEGWEDIKQGTLSLSLPLYLARSDIRQRYRRSSLGPFWITISTGVMIACIGVIFGSLFKAPMSDFLPFLAAGLIIWSFVSNTILEATTVFVTSEPIIKQLPIPLISHVYRMIFRNLYIFLHNIIIFPLVLLFVHRPVNLEILWVIPGLFLLFANLLWISIVLGVVCTRFRDLTQIVASVLQIFFYLTPIIWMPNLLPERTSVMVLDPNPFYHLLALIREPLMAQSPTLFNWVFSILLCLGGSLFAIAFFNKYRNRIAYWL